MPLTQKVRGHANYHMRIDGKVGRRHLNAHMKSKRTRQLRRAGIIAGRWRVQKKYLIALGAL